MTIQPISLTPIGDAAAAPSASCCGGGSCGVASSPAPASSDTAETRDLLVAGMTCDHCVRAVTDELSAIDGVDAVEVDLVAGGSSRVRLRTSSPVSDDDVRSAIDEAGYQLA